MAKPRAMHPDKAEKYYKSLDPNVKKAIKILKKRAKKALRGVGNHDPFICPVGHAYRTEDSDFKAEFCWFFMLRYNRDDLIKRVINDGWTEVLYEAFMHWYDVDAKKSVPFLRYYLAR